MKRILLITLSLILPLVGWSAVGAEDGFYVIPTMKGQYAPVPKTGVTTSYATGDDGDWQKGVISPTPRFTDNGNGTVTDNLTRLIWTKNANAFGTKNWADALSAANSLASGTIPGLTDGSQAGDWRLANVKEFQSLFDYGVGDPALPAGHPFTGVQSLRYWSSTPKQNIIYAWSVYVADGHVYDQPKSNAYYVWCVRGGS